MYRITCMGRTVQDDADLACSLPTLVLMYVIIDFHYHVHE
jgi:hypothetical protein